MHPSAIVSPVFTSRRASALAPLGALIALLSGCQPAQNTNGNAGGSGGRGGSLGSAGGGGSKGSAGAGGSQGDKGGSGGQPGTGGDGGSQSPTDAGDAGGGSPDAAVGGDDSGSSADVPVSSDASATDTGPAAGACEYQNDKQFCACLGKTCGANTMKATSGSYHPVYCGECTAPMACLGIADVAGGAAGTCSSLGGLTDAQKRTAEQLTNLWEYSSPNVDDGAYGSVNNLGDRRGYTVGRAGFCTATGDGILVVQCYHVAKPGNPLDKYLPVLTQIEQMFIANGGNLLKDQDGEAGMIDAVGNFEDDWGKAADDQVFRDCQDKIVEAVYYAPAINHAAEKGFTTALTKAALYDAQINMGETDPGFGMKAMIAMADKKVGPLSNPPTLDEESKWLGAFLRIRAQIMYDDPSADPGAYDVWRPNMYRCANYEKLRLAKNFDLHGCITTGASSAATWPGSGFTTDPGIVEQVGDCK